MNWGYDHTHTVEGWFSPTLTIEGWWDDEAIADDGGAPAAVPQNVLFLLNMGYLR